MPDNAPLDPHIGRATPAKGVHFFYAGPNILWTTICAKDRVPWMAQQPVLDCLHDIWRNEARAWLVGDYLIMPDHLHFFCAPQDLQFTVERWFAFWKDRFSKRSSHDSWKWQRGGFHHRIRSAEEYAEKWTYMMENPIRKGLVNQVDDWPWRGRVHDVRW